ncbi:MAG: ABC transporter permease [Dehalococcoidia bacterium]|nr:ABC transporter permease [Dehalococcoidia bacterium]
MKRLFDPLSSAWTSVVAHKLRSFLTVLGIVIGVGSVIALLAIGQGAQNQIISSIESLGANLVQISPGFSMSQGGVRGAGSTQTLTLEDAIAIEEQVPHVINVAPTLQSSAQLIAGSENTSASVIGTNSAYRDAFNLELAYGAFFSDYDYDRAAKVVVLGSTVAEDLFGEGFNPVGQTIKMNASIVRVIGVLEEKGAGLMTNSDSSVFVPLTFVQQTSAQQRTAQGDHIVSSISLSLEDRQYSTEVSEAVSELLRTRHRLLPAAEDDFFILSTEELSQQVSSAMDVMVIFLGAIAAISLLVGGIGVMNIMLVSVLERTREIGIRKALGAQERTIWTQFLVEAALLTLIGGLIGMALGYGIAEAVGYFVEEITPVVTPDTVILAVSVSVGIGLFFGFYPAWQASRLNPIDALRAE